VVRDPRPYLPVTRATFFALAADVRLLETDLVEVRKADVTFISAPDE
jgi:hypothetical protein